MGSLSNEDIDGNKNGKKVIGLFPSFGPPANGSKSNAKSPDFAQIET